MHHQKYLLLNITRSFSVLEHRRNHPSIRVAFWGQNKPSEKREIAEIRNNILETNTVLILTHGGDISSFLYKFTLRGIIGTNYYA